MAGFDVYTTDGNPKHVYTSDETPSDVDAWVDQLARVSTAPVDFFVDPRANRALWSFRGTHQGTSSRTNRYLADYRGPDEEDLFSGLYTALSNLRASGIWEVSDDDDPRWTAGFDIARLDAVCPGLTADEESALADAVSGQAEQVVLGMSSYSAALQTLKRLTELDVTGTIAINSQGATAETDGVDLVLWPHGDRDFQPMTEASKRILADAGFRSTHDMTVADETPSESAAEIQGRRETPSPIETFVGDTIGRIGAGLSIIFGVTTLAALANTGPVHPISGLAGAGGIVGAVTGLLAVQLLLRATQTGASAGHATTGSAQPDGGTSTATPLLSTAAWSWQQYGAFTGYWLLVAYAYPTIFRLADWPLGLVNTFSGAIPSALLYTGVLLAASLALYAVWALRADDGPHAVNGGSLVVVYGCFAAGLILSTGLACTVWFDVIGFASGAC